QIHVIQQLVLHIPIRYGIGKLQQPIRQCTLPMVNMGDDTEIPDVFHKLTCRKSSKKYRILEAYFQGLDLDLFFLVASVPANESNHGGTHSFFRSFRG